VVETIAGRANMLATHPLNIGPIGVTGSDSANAIAEEADVILAVGTRLQDFTTGSWTAFAKDARIIGLNVGRHDAAKHLSLPVVGDAKLGLEALGRGPGGLHRARRLDRQGQGGAQMGRLCRRQRGPWEPARIPTRRPSAW
jgi:3D-(3,5/4)-trihydroxycyclohexane-1,2-dione acylhydrolase (decyclizing)